MVNVGFSGVELACEKSEFGFTYTTGDNAVSGDSGPNEFMNSWMEINTPTGASGMDDITTYSAIPEFSTLLIQLHQLC